MTNNNKDNIINYNNIIDVDKILSKNFRMLRVLNNLKLEDIAIILEVSAQQVQKYESGKSKIPISKLYKLSVYFDISVDRLVLEI